MSLPRISTLLCIVWVVLAGCTSPERPAVSATGSVQLSLAAQTALPADVSRVTVTVSAADMTARSVDLVQTNGEYGGVLSDLPAGSNRTFLARAFTSSNTLRYEGRAEGVTITTGATTLVSITLQDVSAPPPFTNEAPIIESLVANPATVAPGGSVALTVTARDPNPGDTLTYAWTASAGTFSASSQASTTWTAPSAQGPATLTISVSDSRGATASQRLTVSVAAPAGTGEVKVGFNTAPKVVTLTSSQSALDVGQQTALAVSATDADGDSLSYQWATTCAGSFTGATTAGATFTPSALPTAACNNCQLTVTVKDGRGGQNTGSLALCVTKDPYLGPPVITRSYQSSNTATAGQALTFEVGASDPSAAALGFSWTATVGTLGTATSDASSSRVTWTAPTCAVSGTTPSVTATVSNPRNQKAVRRFTVTGLPTCTVAKWTLTGSMSTRRQGHAATLLPNGKVLVTGGSNTGDSRDALATAELYDPATGTWSPTGSMANKRHVHTSTLLPNGKVLVVAGYNTLTAELYDPDTGTWSLSGSTSTSHSNHHAALLSNGKVLIAGTAYLSNRGAELYDPATGTSTSVGATNVVRSQSTCEVLADGKVLFLGGYDSAASSVSSVMETYNPATNTWSLASMPRARYAHMSAVLPNGKVLVAGGYDNSNASSISSELYDPATGTWSFTGALLKARSSHTATLLANGKVLVAGGAFTGGRLTTGELYDPTTGTWSATSAMVSTRDGHTATLLPNGKVLVVGGYLSDGVPVATAEVYEPGP